MLPKVEVQGSFEEDENIRCITHSLQCSKLSRRNSADALSSHEQQHAQLTRMGMAARLISKLISSRRACIVLDEVSREDL